MVSSFLNASDYSTHKHDLDFKIKKTKLLKNLKIQLNQEKNIVVIMKLESRKKQHLIKIAYMNFIQGCYENTFTNYDIYQCRIKLRGVLKRIKSHKNRLLFKQQQEYLQDKKI